MIEKIRKMWVDYESTMNTSDLNNLTIGFVIDTNDPQQLGRIRALCPAFGDSLTPEDYNIEEIPWAQYCTPFAGVIDEDVVRGPEDKRTPGTGPLSYGLWSPPRVGGQVLVMCIDGDPQHRIYIGSLLNQHTTHTLPHGRYSYNIPTVGGNTLDGPFSSTESPIQPLYDNLTNSFTSTSPLGNNGRESIEWLTRGADFSAAALDNQNIPTSFSDIPDDKDHSVTLPDSTRFVKRQGYAIDRINPQRNVSSTGAVYDNTVYSWSTPGFHAMSMDDRPENCRMRFRTTTGHQIILDDTNERIYVSTAEGKNWIEMDQKGNVDIYAERKISIHSESDVNINSSADIRMSAKNIHLNASEEVRMSSNGNVHLKADSNILLNAGGDINSDAGGAISFLSGGETLITSGSTLELKASGEGMFQGSNLNFTGGSIINTGTTFGNFVGTFSGTAVAPPGESSGGLVGTFYGTLEGTASISQYANAAGQAGVAGGTGSVSITVPTPLTPPNPPTVPTAATSTSSSASNALYANLTTRKPLHEPWPRISYNLDLTDVSSPGSIPQQVLEHDVNSLEVNLEDHGTAFNRNPYWLR